MADPVIVVSPAPIADGQNVTLDTSAFNNKLAATDNLLQELADKFDDHAHAYSEITSNTHSHNMSALTNFLAPDDNLTDLGSADKRWKDIYAGNAVIQTSDRNYKEDIRDIQNSWAFLSALRPREFRFKGGSRVHTGFIAQDVKEALPKDYAIYCEQNGVCGLRYEEAIAPIVDCVQDLACARVVLSEDIREIREAKEGYERAIRVITNSLLERVSELEASASHTSSVSSMEHRATVDALVSRISEIENKKEDKPTNWVAWVAIGISVIAGLCHFL